MVPELQFKHYFYKKKLMGILRQFGEYLFIKKRDPNQPRTQWMKYMHGMNRISLIVFIFAILFTLFRVFILPLFK